MRMTSAFLRKLSLNAEKNWHQKSGAKRRESMRCVAIVDCSGGSCRGGDDRRSPRHVAAEPSGRTARIGLAVDDAARVREDAVGGHRVPFGARLHGAAIERRIGRLKDVE